MLQFLARTCTELSDRLCSIGTNLNAVNWMFYQSMCINQMNRTAAQMKWTWIKKTCFSFFCKANNLTLTSLLSFFKGYGNIAPKTSAGRVFCIFYGLFGVPLCLSWISELGKFFGGRAKHLGQYLTKKGFSLVSWYELFFSHFWEKYLHLSVVWQNLHLKQCCFLFFFFSRERLNLPAQPFFSCGVYWSI